MWLKIIQERGNSELVFELHGFPYLFKLTHIYFAVFCYEKGVFPCI